MTKIEVNSEREIAASPEAVWAVLTDLKQFHAWNPFIRDASGSVRVGGTVRVRVQPTLRFALRFRATVLEVDQNHALRWRGSVLSRWLAAGDHSFTIEPVGEGRVRFTQHETFSGLLPRLAGRLLRRETQRGFDAMNEALDARVHQGAPS